MTLIQTFICASLMGYPHVTFANDEDTPVRMELKAFGDSARPPDDPLLAMKGFVELQRVQPGVSRGIEILLDISNEGPSTVRLLNPVEWVYILLQNADGIQVELPRVQEEWRACGPSSNIDPAQLEARRGARDARRPFVMKIESESHRATLAPPSDRILRVPAKLELSPGEDFRATIQVTQVLADPKGYWDQIRDRMQTPPDTIIPTPEPPPIVRIRSGTYKLKVSVFLGTGPDGPRSRRVESDWITARLGPPSGGGD